MNLISSYGKDVSGGRSIAMVKCGAAARKAGNNLVSGGGFIPLRISLMTGGIYLIKLRLMEGGTPYWRESKPVIRPH